MVPEGTNMDRPEAFTSAAVVPDKLETALWVQGPLKLEAVSTATLFGPVLLLRRFELIPVTVNSYPAAADTE